MKYPWKYRINKKNRGVRFWLAKKIMPSGGFTFLNDPMGFEIGLTQLKSEKVYDEGTYEFLNVKHIKEVLVNQMTQNMANHLDYEVKKEDGKVICIGELTLAERRVK